MNSIEPNLSSRPLAALTLAVLLLLFAFPAAASAQDPSADQYAEGTPGIEGDEAPDEDPVPNSGNGDNPGDAGTGGAGGGRDGGSSVESILPSTPASEGGSSAAEVPTSGGSAETAGSRGAPVAAEQPNKAQRDLATIAAGAVQERAAIGRGPADEANATTELLRSDSGGSPGMGIFLLILLGGTLIWAVVSGVNRRRDGRLA